MSCSFNSRTGIVRIDYRPGYVTKSFTHFLTHRGPVSHEGIMPIYHSWYARRRPTPLSRANNRYKQMATPPGLKSPIQAQIAMQLSRGRSGEVLDYREPSRPNAAMGEKNPNDMTGTVERIYKAWDEALGVKDLDAALALYASDATFESPLVAPLLGVESGICQGHEELRRFIHLVFQRQPAARKRFRTGYFTDGTKLMWEYPRAIPDGEQMDLWR